MTTSTSTTSMPPPPSPHHLEDHESSSSLHHRRIDLQSPLDLHYLQNNATRAARAKIDLHLPLEAAMATNRAEGGGDDIRRAVEMEVRRFLEETFEGVKKGISVNGVEGEKVGWKIGDNDFEFEPYDTDLAGEISALHASIETLNLELANTRRMAVKEAADKFRADFEAQSQAADEQLDHERENAGSGNANDVDIVNLSWEGRDEDVKRVWEDSLKTLNGLTGDLEACQKRAEEARAVVEYMEGEKK